MRRVCVPLCVVLAGQPAIAGGLAIVGGSPRAVGRAGTGVVGDDGGGALLVNPATLARRETTRVQLGIAFVDDGMSWTADHPDAPIARDQAGSRALPLASVIGEIGGWVIGGGVMTAGVSARALRDPDDVPDPTQLGAAFEYRYSGIAGSLRRDTVSAGVARRIGDTVALGVALGLSRVTLGETRRLWAGFAGIHPVGDPQADVEVSFAGSDPLSPSAVAGLLVAPVDAPMELAASVAWAARTEIGGDVTAAGTTGGPSVTLSRPSAQLAFRQPITARAGARYLADRFVVELGGDLWITPRGADRTEWRVEGVQVTDPSSLGVDLVRIPSRLSQRTQGAIRGAVELEVIAGFLWATAGYAYMAGGTTERRLSASLGSLGGHTVALGIEGTAGGLTYTIGWSRTLASARRGGGDLALDNPFDAGDAAVASGTFDAAADQLGLLLDLELDAPE